MSTELRYQIRLTQRVSAGSSDEAGNVRRAHQVLPGAVIRGALAARWFAETGATTADEWFIDVFERATIFGAAVPIGMRLETVSSSRCKYPADAECERWSEDGALVLSVGGTPASRCPSCDGALTHGTNGWSTGDRLGGRATRVQLTAEETATDEAGSGRGLYTRQHLDPGLLLTGRLRVDLADDHLGWLTTERTIRVGGQRSVLGAATWTVPDAGSQGRPPQSPAGRTALVLRSPALLVDDYGAPTAHFRTAFEHALGRPVTVVRAWMRAESVQGWNAAAGLPKPHEWAAAAGSTVVVDGLTADDLTVLEEGIGLRRIEGFGEIAMLTPAALTPAATSNTAADEPTASGSPAVVFEPERSTAPQPPPQPPPAGPTRRDVIARIAETTPQAARAGVLRAVLAAIRSVSNYHRARVTGAPLDAIITGALADGSLRVLPDAVQAQVRRILTDATYAPWEAAVVIVIRDLNGNAGSGTDD